MEHKSTTITEEYNENGILLRKITETVEERDDDGHIYPHDSVHKLSRGEDFSKLVARHRD